MANDARARITEILAELGRPDPAAVDELLALVYAELHALARARMARERPGNTLQPTALVHEVYLRLFGERETTWSSRAHFFGAAAEAMRRILVEHARAKARDKRGGGRRRTTLDDHQAADGADPTTVLDVDRALAALERQDRTMAEVVKLRYFLGFSVPETARLLELSERTVNRHWTAARAWLLVALDE